jgi:hypothetical protein
VQSVSMNRTCSSGVRCPPTAYDSQAQRQCRMRPWLGQEGAFRELSSCELEHSRDVENGLPPCLSVYVCRYAKRYCGET